MIKLAEFTEDRINQIMYDIKKAIYQVQLQKFNEEGIRIQVPSYFSELMMHHNMRNVSGFTCDENNLECFGVKVIPSYDNFIVVYHKDMPLHQNTSYQVISLK